MKEFTAIRIVHNIINRIEFNFFAEFFRFCGIYVGEFILYSENEYANKEISLVDMNSGDCFDADLYVGLYDIDESVESFSEDAIFLKTVFQDEKIEISSIMKLTESDKEKILDSVLSGLESRLAVKDIEFNKAVFDELANIYIGNDLMHCFSNLQYYRRKNEKQNELIEKLESACMSLGVDKDDYRKWYAFLYCASKVNSASFYQDKVFKYEIEDLAEECRNLIISNTDFSNAWVLLGLIFEHVPLYAKEAVVAFEKALTYISEYSYSSHVYYWIAKRYEAYSANQEEAFKYYKKAYEKKIRFRNIYKVASYYEKIGKYDDAIAEYEKIIVYLQDKLDKRYLDPLECEYYCKAHSMIVYICIEREQDYDMAVCYCEKVLDFINNLNQMEFFQDFYGKDEEIYRGFTMKRISKKKIYLYLMISYRELGEFNMAEEYRVKANEIA